MDYDYIETLAANAKNGDRSSKENLVYEFRPFILNISKRTFIHGYNNDDIQNECYKTLFRCVSLYKVETHRFVSYATNGIKNSINDLIRRTLTKKSTEGSETLTLSDDLEHTLVSDESSIEDIICNNLTYTVLKQAIESLSIEEQELIDFLFFKNNTVRAYACMQNMCYSTAIQRKNNALKKLWKFVTRFDEMTISII